MNVSALLNGTSNIRSSNYMYQMTQNLITQSTSMESQIYSVLQQMDAETSSSESTSAAFTSIDSFLKTYQSDLNELTESAVSLQTGNRQSIFSQYEDGDAELDDVVAAVEDFVNNYNDVTKLLEKNAERGTGVASHLSSFSRGIASEEMLKSLGISYGKDGTLELDKESLKKELEENYDSASKAIGGQYGLADRAKMKADQALQDSVQRIVSNDLQSLINDTQNFSSISYTNNFNKAGVFNLTNMYAVGLFVNTLA